MTGSGTMIEASELVLGVDMSYRPSASTRRPRLSRGRTLLGVLGSAGGLRRAGSGRRRSRRRLSKELIARGKYVFGVAAGCGCHTEPKKVATALNAGGRKYDGPFGTVYATNITPDPETGHRQVDGRADHHGDSRGPTAQWRAAHPRAPVSDLQRHGGGGSARGGGLPQIGAPGAASQYAEEDLGADVRDRLPPRLARRLRAARDAARRPRPRRAWLAENTWCGRSVTAASAIRPAA